MHTFDESYFDAGLDRRGTRCEKWDGTEKESVLPLWVADMDFPSPPEGAEALAVRALHPTYGYTLVLPDDTRALSSFWQRRHNLTIQDEWVMMIPCVVTGIRLALLALTKPGDTIMGLSLDAGGHLTHGAKPAMSGKWFNAVQYGVREDTHLIDYDAV